MKKFLCITLIIIFSVSFISCSNNSNASSKTSTLNFNEEEQVDISEFVLNNPEICGLCRRDYLTDKGKEIYDGLYDSVLNFEDYIYVCKDEIKSLEDYAEKFNIILSYYVLIDHPELFWTEGGFAYINSNKNENDETQLKFQLSFGCKKEEVERYKSEINEKINEIISDIPDKSNYEKVLYVYDWIMNNTIYLDRPMISASKNLDYSIYNLFINGKSNCNGYSKAFSLIMDKLGIPCTIAVGECNDSVLHGWNIIELDNKYYHLDSTWDDKYNKYSFSNSNQYISHAYFCVTDEEIYQSRQLINDFYVPECNSNEYNYYIYNNLYFSELNDDVFKKAIEFSENNSTDIVEMKFSNKQILDEAIDYIKDENSSFKNILSNSKYKNRVNISYGSIDDANVLCFN